MLVVLLRHGPAGQPDAEAWPDDRRRPLTERGAERTRRATEALATLLGSRALILTSPLVRAHATAEILRDAIGEGATTTTLDALAPGATHRKTLEALAAHDGEETIVLVGHEPDLGKLAGVLLLGAPRALPLKKAGACALAFDGPPRPGEAELRWFLTPRILRRLGARAGKDRKLSC